MMGTPVADMPGPIGVFDSGYGGLTILHEIRQLMPQYDYLYLGDNARTPYGTRSFEVVYEFTREAVQKLFGMGCHLVILACNTASAKALKTIQQNDLPKMEGQMRRVLGVIRPTAECIGKITHTRHVGILATSGTISSGSYPLEIQKLFSQEGMYVNADGFAISWAVKQFRASVRHKFLLVISDGTPTAAPGTLDPRIHVRESVRKAQREGIIVLSLGISNFDQADMYDEFIPYSGDDVTFRQCREMSLVIPVPGLIFA